jgi:general secretion pathway protein D
MPASLPCRQPGTWRPVTSFTILQTERGCPTHLHFARALQSRRQRWAGQPREGLPRLGRDAKPPLGWVLWVFVYLAAGAGLGNAQEEPPRWFLTGDEVELVDLIDACAAGLDLALDYDRGQVQGKVTIRSDLGFSDEGMWALLNRALLARKLATVQAPGEEALAIVAVGEAAKVARIERDITTARAGFVKALKTLHYAESEKVAEALRLVLTGEGTLVQAIKDAHEVLLAGPKPQVIEALGLVDRLDSPIPPAVAAFPIRNSTPATVAALLERVTKAMEQVGKYKPEGVVLADPPSGSILVVAPEPELLWWKEEIERFDQAQPSTTRNYVPQRFSLEETAKLVEEVARGPVEGAATWRMVEDGLTGTLVITATPAQHEAVERLLNRLENAPADSRIALRAFPVRHRDVDEFLGLLESLLMGVPLPAGTAEGAAAPEGEERSALPAAPSMIGGRPVPEASDLTLSKDSGTNRILAVGPPRLLTELGRLIEDLDVAHPQVLVETLIVTLTDNQTRDLAVELVKIGESDGTLWRLASLFGAAVPDPAEGVLPGAGGSGVEGVLLDPGSFAGVLRALETVNHGRTLNVPKVLVNNNQTANLDSLLQSPYATSNTSTNLATISFGGTLDAGTSVQVTPQITDGDQLLIEYTVSLSTFVGDSSDPTLPPPRQETKLASQATVPDGYTVVLGGLEVEAETDAESRVPILGRIPLLGNLFKSQSKTTTRSRFFVFLRCSVLRSASFEDLRYLSAHDLVTAGVGDDLPVVEPRVIR